MKQIAYFAFLTYNITTVLQHYYKPRYIYNITLHNYIIPLHLRQIKQGNSISYVTFREERGEGRGGREGGGGREGRGGEGREGKGGREGKREEGKREEGRERR